MKTRSDNIQSQVKRILKQTKKSKGKGYISMDEKTLELLIRSTNAGFRGSRYGMLIKCKGCGTTHVINYVKDWKVHVDKLYGEGCSCGSKSLFDMTYGGGNFYIAIRGYRVGQTKIDL